ncbi:MAG: EamA family transporter [Alphaproteobacteria bacterium]|nr:EamA family transporter [Alphaproteobacteria bacterium]
MQGIDVVAALLSALLPAGWNAAVKASPDPARAMTAQMLTGALLLLPLLLWTGLPAAAAWPWIAVSTAVNLVIVSAMLRAYELAGFALVFPVMRAIGVMLVVPLAGWVAGERLGTAALAGVVAIALAVGMLALDAARDRSLGLAALGFTLLAGCGTALYILADAQGVRASGDALAYGIVVSATNALAMCWRRRADGPPWIQLRGYWLASLPVALASMASYLLILWVWTRAPIAPAAALRDTSAVFAILIAVFVLKERLTNVRIAALVVTVAAIPLLRLG